MYMCMKQGAGHLLGYLDGCLVLDATHTPREQAATKAHMFEVAKCRGEEPPFSTQYAAGRSPRSAWRVEQSTSGPQ